MPQHLCGVCQSNATPYDNLSNARFIHPVAQELQAISLLFRLTPGGAWFTLYHARAYPVACVTTASTTVPCGPVCWTSACTLVPEQPVIPRTLLLLPAIGMLAN